MIWTDHGYRGPTQTWAEEERGWRMEVVRHREQQLWRYGLEEKPAGFQVLPKRWVVERTFAWLSRYRPSDSSVEYTGAILSLGVSAVSPQTLLNAPP